MISYLDKKITFETMEKHTNLRSNKKKMATLTSIFHWNVFYMETIRITSLVSLANPNKKLASRRGNSRAEIVEIL